MDTLGDDKIVIQGAREHNLKNINVELPRNKLVAISGLSGSGKSSLAFDTLFAEGQRRYMESLSSYARQFLGRMDKPDVDLITGLSPAISIEQKTTHKNPRSTVGTVTEIYDYYRLLFARIGHPHCPICGREIKEQSVDQIVSSILSWSEGTKLTLLAPVIRGKKGEHQKVLDDAKKAGFVRARIDSLMVDLEEVGKLDKQKKHTIEIVIDRIVLKEEATERIAQSVEVALEISGGTIIVLRRVYREDEAFEAVQEEFLATGKSIDGEAAFIEQEVFFSQKNSCPDCGVSIPELEPRLFSFNNPVGACSECGGLGEKMEYDKKLIVRDESLSFNEGGLMAYNPDNAWNQAMLGAVADQAGFSLNQPLNTLTKAQSDYLWRGDATKPLRWVYEKQSGEGFSTYTRPWLGIFNDMRRRYNEAWGDNAREALERFMSHKECTACHGKRLKKEALAVTVGDKSIWDLCCLSVLESIEFFAGLEITDTERQIASQILKEITSRLDFLRGVGLEYLTLDRSAATLSGGEAQRIRLSTQIGSALTGVMYVLDEPSIGLHQRDNKRLIDSLLRLRDLKNTVIVVEHDEQTLLSADYIVDMGPGAGVRGGFVTAAGTPEDVMSCDTSLTGSFLSGRLYMEIPKIRRTGSGKEIRILGAREHNLRNINVTLPLGCFVCITGVSGSGKSTLLNDVFFPAASNRVMKSSLKETSYRRIEGLDAIDKIINIDQSPIGRTPRSNPATYIGVFDKIRELYAATPEAKAKGYKSGRFSFNVKGGRCESCLGAGMLTIEMNFLPDVFIPCDVCGGKRFNRETLSVLYKGKSISDVLDMSVSEAATFFSGLPQISRKIETLESVGLGYIKLGQNALTLSGGEAQRIKLASELSRPSTGRTLYILDEPTTGLHFADIKQLMDVIARLVDKGNSVVMIEHNLDVICQADWIVDLGPEGGPGGGQVVAVGTPEDVAQSESWTGKFVKAHLERDKAREEKRAVSFVVGL